MSTGLYGFRFAGVAGDVGDGEPDWPLLDVVRDPADDAAPRPQGTVDVRDGAAEIWLQGGDRIELDRAARTIRFVTREPLSDAAVLHPFLALPAAIHGHWLGRHTLHGGAFRHSGGACAVLATKGGGKSSTLAGLLGRGQGIVSDDVLVLDGRDLFAGPRCVDLREEAARVLGGDSLGVVGARERWRLTAGAVPARLPLTAIVHLVWGDDVRLEPMPAGERLAGLIEHSVIRPDGGTAMTLLELAALPTWRLVRPRDIDRIDASLDVLLSALR